MSPSRRVVVSKGVRRDHDHTATPDIPVGLSHVILAKIESMRGEWKGGARPVHFALCGAGGRGERERREEEKVEIHASKFSRFWANLSVWQSRSLGYFPDRDF